VQLLKTITLATTLLLGSQATLASNADEDVAKRIAPVGKVYLAENTANIKPAEPTGPRDGATIYQSTCSACHGTGLLGAPKYGVSEDWAARIAQGKATLLSHALEGFNQMPAKGACANCSDDEITAAVDHMLDAL